MDVRRLTVGCLARQLSECNQEAEVKVIIGNIPQAIPVETLTIKEDLCGNEIVALSINHDTFVEILDYGIDLISEGLGG